MTSHFSRPRRWAARAGALALGAALAAGTLAGCSTSSGDDAGSKTITVWGWGDPVKGMKAAVPAFEKKHAGVTVKVQDVGNPAIWDKVTTGMAAGGSGLPDVIDVGADYMSNYLETFPDGFADLTPLGADKLEKNFPTGLWGGAQKADGHQYGIPFEVNTSLIFYRTDLFQQAGVDPASVETWDQMLDAGKKIKAATGADLFAVDKAATQADAANFWQMLARQSESFFFDKKGDIDFTSKGSVDALEFMKKANDAGLIADVPQSQGTTSQAKGETPVALLPLASWAVSTFANDAPDMQGKWAVRTPPATEAGGLTAASAGGTYLAVTKASKNQQLAYDFVEFSMATLEGQQLVYDGGHLFPSFKPMWETDAFKADNDYFGINTNDLVMTALNQKTPPDYYTKDYAKALKAYDDAQTQVLVSGADPKKALSDAAELLAGQTGRKIAKG
ncbi:extracellular solute-binding protein [Schumannella luteola]|jgi:lactose/L-arabinose transport system substrate-binding protein|uniref:Lactose/L-arabinose transport system substrate-binding protein n=1 Tax=Schumannella luteola TaxID=472059 RepID=A0A852YC17_9MICO|nr:sugar ABC transporter substrate-binding protein [Schumannella luteola]NYG98880.1 lactose/L-arabinose transport system substrate-binding protein [Schumannella luteola]TPX01945.1 sugar ABC transporter substrate-binding protein [Schumannella luteola]